MGTYGVGQIVVAFALFAIIVWMLVIAGKEIYKNSKDNKDEQ